MPTICMSISGRKLYRVVAENDAKLLLFRSPDAANLVAHTAHWRKIKSRLAQRYECFDLGQEHVMLRCVIVSAAHHGYVPQNKTDPNKYHEASNPECQSTVGFMRTKLHPMNWLEERSWQNGQLADIERTDLRHHVTDGRVAASLCCCSDLRAPLPRQPV